MKPLARLLAIALFWLANIAPAQAAVTITFWSHEFGNEFPHAFFTLRGVPDAGGAPVDGNWGFTAKSITPAILFGSVPGKVEPAKPNYVRHSDAQFSVVLTDAQYAAIVRLIDEWDAVKGDGTYNMNTRNCVTFTQEAARRAGIANVDFPKLMKKPRSFLKAVAAANPAQVTLVAMHGDAYLAGLPPVTPVVVVVPIAPTPAAAAVPVPAN